MELKTIHRQFGLPILSNGKLPVGIRHSELPLSQIDTVFKQIKNCGIRIELLGGEPLLRPDLEVIVKKAKHDAHSPFVSVYSNGMLATPNVCNSLKVAGLDAAIVTLISTNKQVHGTLFCWFFKSGCFAKYTMPF
jgi:molybdenum cofactor biosynthesis enzyme MoaA